MSYVTQNWSFDPVAVLMFLTVVAHEVGLSRLARRSRPAAQRRRRRRALAFYAGLVTLALSIMSPLDYWSSRYFFVHMIDHLFLAFFAPILLVFGAPWVPLHFCLPVRARRAVGKFLFLSSSTRGLRALGRALRTPLFAVLFFNVVMLGWHVPVAYDYSETHLWVHVWLMHTSFVLAGVLFWLQILPSHPMRPAKGPIWQAGAILVTNVIMTVTAMSMSILTSSSWYSIYAHVPGVTMSPFEDQQIGAAILWVCGDFWALPMLFIVIRRAVETEGSMSDVFDRVFRGRHEDLEIVAVPRRRTGA